MNQQNSNYRPEMTNAGIEASYPVTVMDEFGNKRETHITGERPLTIYVDKREIVTLMTLGKYPELLVIGYLHNQGFIKNSGEIKAVQVDWDIDSAVVVTRNGIGGWEKRLEKRTVTSGCGQGTVFGDLMDNLDDIQLPIPTLHQSSFYSLLHNIREYNEVYKKSGAVHGCALCKGEKIEVFIEDVGRHNATDAIAGHMLLEGIDGADKLFLYNRTPDLRNGNQSRSNGHSRLVFSCRNNSDGNGTGTKTWSNNNCQSRRKALFGLQWCRNSSFRCKASKEI